MAHLFSYNLFWENISAKSLNKERSAVFSCLTLLLEFSLFLLLFVLLLLDFINNGKPRDCEWISVKHVQTKLKPSVMEAMLAQKCSERPNTCLLLSYSFSDSAISRTTSHLWLHFETSLSAAFLWCRNGMWAKVTYVTSLCHVTVMSRSSHSDITQS